MIGIFKLWQAFINQINTHQGGFWSPQQNFTSAVNDISRELMQEKFADWQNSQKLTDDVFPFLETINLKVVLGVGLTYDIATLPANYVHYSSARVLIQDNVFCGCKIGTNGKPALVIDGKTGECVECGPDDKYLDPDVVAMAERKAGQGLIEGAVRIIDNQRWSALCSSITKKPTLTRPGITMFNGGLKVYPKNIGILILDYFRMPKDAVFNYILTPNDEIQFVPAGSVDLEWPASVQPEFIARLLKKYGIFTGQNELYQIGEMERQILK